jgi:hypothetical protein
MSARGGKKKGAKKKAPSWQCNWCHTSKTRWKSQGPDGPKTLCDKCGRLHAKGETGPRSADWECAWCGADDSETPRRQKELCLSCHGRRMKGATGPPAKNWQCDWCPETSGRRRKGPKGPETLCDPCGRRFSDGKTGPPSATFECRWCGANHTHKRYDGPTGEDTLCEPCGHSYVQASDKIKARLDHVEKELDRLTSVPAIDVDEGTETRIPRPKRSSEAPGGGLKALKAASDATAGAFRQVKREKEALEDRLLCTICMEADAPRTVLFGPCNHFLACASCAEKLAECPNCRATITTRTPIANSS